jgi:hypothetical protein
MSPLPIGIEPRAFTLGESQATSYEATDGAGASGAALEIDMAHGMSADKKTIGVGYRMIINSPVYPFCSSSANSGSGLTVDVSRPVERRQASESGRAGLLRTGPDEIAWCSCNRPDGTGGLIAFAVPTVGPQSISGIVVKRVGSPGADHLRQVMLPLLPESVSVTAPNFIMAAADEIADEMGALPLVVMPMENVSASLARV